MPLVPLLLEEGHLRLRLIRSLQMTWIGKKLLDLPNRRDLLNRPVDRLLSGRRLGRFDARRDTVQQDFRLQ